MLSGLQILSVLIFIGGIYYGMKHFRKEIGGYIDYFKAFVVGAQTAFFTSVILAFVFYMAAKIEPQVIEVYLNTSEKMFQSWNLPSGVVENSMQQMREMLTPGVIAMACIMTYSLVGVFISLICAIFIKNDQPRVAP